MEVDGIDALGALALPLVIAAINQRRWSPQMKGGVALLACIMYALVAVIIRDGFDGSRWRDTALVAIGIAFVSYRQIWQPTGIAPAIERKINPGPPPPAPRSGRPLTEPGTEPAL